MEDDFKRPDWRLLVPDLLAVNWAVYTDAYCMDMNELLAVLARATTVAQVKEPFYSFVDKFTADEYVDGSYATRALLRKLTELSYFGHNTATMAAALESLRKEATGLSKPTLTSIARIRAADPASQPSIQIPVVISRLPPPKGSLVKFATTFASGLFHDGFALP